MFLTTIGPIMIEQTISKVGWFIIKITVMSILFADHCRYMLASKNVSEWAFHSTPRTCLTNIIIMFTCWIITCLSFVDTAITGTGQAVKLSSY